ncbi:MAG: permease [Candidatus Neomarinimicrobiota bacterium]|nr:MAG: permease [Candidatus Neomarinimicrobiota bacterium]
MPLFRKPTPKETAYLVVVIAFYVMGVFYVVTHQLSLGALFKYGLLQPTGVTGEDARLREIATPLSWNLPQVAGFILLKSTAVLVELFQYWAVGMLIAAALTVLVPWSRVREKMGYGGLKSNFLATVAGSVIPICSCGIVPVLAGMVEAGIPLGPTMAFLIAAPMLNVPAVFITAGVLGWKLAVGRIIGTFFIALLVGGVLSAWQKKHRLLRRFVKLTLTPRLTPDLQQFAFQVSMQLTNHGGALRTEDLAPGKEEELYLLGEAGVLDRDAEGRWFLPETSAGNTDLSGACFVLPTGDVDLPFRQRMRNLVQTAWDLFLQLNYYLVLAVLIAGAIKVVIPTAVVVNLVGGDSLNSVLIASAVAVLAYVCTYVEVPTALALIQKGMGGGATLAYLLGGPGLSLPSIAMLSGVFKPKVLVLYVSFSFLGCVIMGYLFNLLM